jgi:hypothetical protein
MAPIGSALVNSNVANEGRPCSAKRRSRSVRPSHSYGTYRQPFPIAQAQAILMAPIGKIPAAPQLFDDLEHMCYYKNRSHYEPFHNTTPDCSLSSPPDPPHPSPLALSHLLIAMTALALLNAHYGKVKLCRNLLFRSQSC